MMASPPICTATDAYISIPAADLINDFFFHEANGNTSCTYAKSTRNNLTTIPAPLLLSYSHNSLHQKHNSTKSRSNLFTWNWLIVHSLSVVACIQRVSAESWKTFFMLSSRFSVACCFPIPLHTFSQPQIDSSSSQRESEGREQNIVVDV